MFADQAQPHYYYSLNCDIMWIPKLSGYMHTLQNDIKPSVHIA